VLTVTVSGFEPDEFIDPNATGLLVSGVPVRVGVNQLARTATTRVPTIFVIGGALSPNELSFSCSQVSDDPKQLAGQLYREEAGNAQGVPQTITFWFAVTFNDVFSTFFFPFGSTRYLDLQVSFQVDTKVTTSARLVLIGGTVGEPGGGGAGGWGEIEPGPGLHKPGNVPAR
jgi:hypothetical protein